MAISKDSHVLARNIAAGSIGSHEAAWLCGGFAAWLGNEAGRLWQCTALTITNEAGKAATLEQALGLDRASSVRQRNAALLEAASVLESGRPPWVVAGLLAQSIRKFERQILPVWRKSPPTEVSELHAALARAFETGIRIPRTQRKIYDLLR